MSGQTQLEWCTHAPGAGTGTDRARLVGEGASAVQAASADAHERQESRQDGEAGG